MENEEDVLDWMVSQKMDESIEEIDRETLNEYITSKDFLAVVFCKIDSEFVYSCLQMSFNLYIAFICNFNLVKKCYINDLNIIW